MLEYSVGKMNCSPVEYLVNTGIKIVTNVLNSLTVHVSSVFTRGLSLMSVLVNFYLRKFLSFFCFSVWLCMLIKLKLKKNKNYLK